MTKDFPFKGFRVEIAPHYDRWMMGDRYGEIVGFVESRDLYRVKMDKSGNTIKIDMTDLSLVD